MSKIKNGRLDQYGTETFEQQKFGPAGVEWVRITSKVAIYWSHIAYYCASLNSSQVQHNYYRNRIRTTQFYGADTDGRTEFRCAFNHSNGPGRRV